MGVFAERGRGGPEIQGAAAAIRVLLRLPLPAAAVAPLAPIGPRTMSGRPRPLRRLLSERVLGMLTRGELTWSGSPEIAKGK